MYLFKSIRKRTCCPSTSVLTVRTIAMAIESREPDACASTTSAVISTALGTRPRNIQVRTRATPSSLFCCGVEDVRQVSHRAPKPTERKRHKPAPNRPQTIACRRCTIQSTKPKAQHGLVCSLFSSFFATTTVRGAACWSWCGVVARLAQRPRKSSNMDVTEAQDGVKVYNLSTGKSMQEWLAEYGGSRK